MITRSKTNIMATNDELKLLIETIRTDLGSKIDALVKKLDEKDEKIEELQNKVKVLEEQIAYKDKRFELLDRRLDDSEQYSRRTSLRLNGIPYSGKETAAESLQKVKDEVSKLGLEDKLLDFDFDRAHRVGPVHDQNGKLRTDRQMIVKFTSFRARTAVYRGRKKRECENLHRVND